MAQVYTPSHLIVIIIIIIIITRPKCRPPGGPCSSVYKGAEFGNKRTNTLPSLLHIPASVLDLTDSAILISSFNFHFLSAFIALSK